ncbi:hypothetical protein B9Z55_027277 [Caenorhabditis nigoni]|uniref:DUF19 domain-containing protein n=1 Tax=Caenorhabditis nigoni TaxID=1611254 RepID=A0A2G5SH17_9PELO|nr:hypothetical protein B9Z55_027277 [Caenorhabditis nigoni]
MKTYLHVILLLLAIAGSVTSGIFDDLANPPRKEETLQETVDRLNRARKEHAEKQGVGNMHEVKLDEELLKTAVSISNCDDKKGSFEILKKSELFSTSDKNRVRPKGYHPLQTRIACTKHLTTCKKYDEDICLLGPHTNPTEDQVKTGTLGAKCNTGVNVDGLCNAPKADPNSANPVSESSIQNGSIQKSILILFFFALAIIMVLV